jgi:hypothetical protein
MVGLVFEKYRNFGFEDFEAVNNDQGWFFFQFLYLYRYLTQCNGPEIYICGCGGY